MWGLADGAPTRPPNEGPLNRGVPAGTLKCPGLLNVPADPAFAGAERIAGVVDRMDGAAVVDRGTTVVPDEVVRAPENDRGSLIVLCAAVPELCVTVVPLRITGSAVVCPVFERITLCVAFPPEES